MPRGELDQDVYAYEVHLPCRPQTGREGRSLPPESVTGRAKVDLSTNLLSKHSQTHHGIHRGTRFTGLTVEMLLGIRTCWILYASNACCLPRVPHSHFAPKKYTPDLTAAPATSPLPSRPEQMDVQRTGEVEVMSAKIPVPLTLLFVHTCIMHGMLLLVGLRLNSVAFISGVSDVKSTSFICHRSHCLCLIYLLPVGRTLWRAGENYLTKGNGKRAWSYHPQKHLSISAFSSANVSCIQALRGIQIEPSLNKPLKRTRDCEGNHEPNRIADLPVHAIPRTRIHRKTRSEV
ncbi:hypothetical protein SODALDRAFT_355669 [Sodiomyces alkalinus F11]|uniref:Uncharacterized protein n=1 Tax=Sodiomyces alkalinus (strain CBS 110278 / VKM F-3762 / F11) TaxID=1314773 RepID=A0A3N2Q9M1_SODAK|nr:hypothetical protein SODALDRAFT_355669 [Sodiomyces alkalinus F11]ROT43464.1 hypothetical protein SODALDRAFT_355669 [Sodiomyces alkalinus F11]